MFHWNQKACLRGKEWSIGSWQAANLGRITSRALYLVCMWFKLNSKQNKQTDKQTKSENLSCVIIIKFKSILFNHNLLLTHCSYLGQGLKAARNGTFADGKNLSYFSDTVTFFRRNPLCFFVFVFFGLFVCRFQRLISCQVKVTIGSSGLCCICAMSFWALLNPFVNKNYPVCLTLSIFF